MKNTILIAVLLLTVACQNKKEPAATEQQTSSQVTENQTVNNSLIVAADTTSQFTNFPKPKGITFPSADVQPAANLLSTVPATIVFEEKIGKKLLYFPAEHRSFGLVPCRNNGLIQTLQECYDIHRPLLLSPDAIWLAICQGVSLHINENYKSLEKTVFTADKPKKLVVRNDSLSFSPRHWSAFVDTLSNKTRQYTRQDFYSFFVPQFSTTTGIEKTAYQITLLESYKKGFEYIGESGCGIPSITITGTKEDWQAIQSKLEMLYGLGLNEWADNLKPIIQQFIDVFDGKMDKNHWNSIYKNASEYNGFYISGWIIKFFPYTKSLDPKGVYDEKTGETRVKEIISPNKFMSGSRYELSTLSTDNFPSGVAKIDVLWNDFFKNQSHKIELYAGFFAIKQYPDKTLEPFISWAVGEKESDAVSFENRHVADEGVRHKTETFWSPHLCKNPKKQAVYNPKKNKTSENGIADIKLLLKDSLTAAKFSEPAVLSKISVQFTVTTNGAIEDIEVKNTKNAPEIAAVIRRRLLSLPAEWFPALSHPTDVLELMDAPDDADKILVRVNSVVKFSLL